MAQHQQLYLSPNGVLRPASASGGRDATLTPTSNTSRTSAVTTNIDKFSPTGRSAMDSLFATLSGGGTSTQRNQSNALNTLMASLQAQSAQYSPEAATTAAQGNVAGFTRLLLEKLAPDISQASEGAGASANALDALLKQDAATRVGEAQSRAVLEAIKTFGTLRQGVDTNLLNATTSADTSMTALLQALNIGKGSAERGTTTSASTSTTSGNQDSASGGANDLTKVAALESLIGGGLYNQFYQQSRGGLSSPDMFNTANTFATDQLRAQLGL